MIQMPRSGHGTGGGAQEKRRFKLTIKELA